MEIKKKLSLIPVIITILSIALVSMSLQCGAGGEAPAVELEIYDGPEFSESDNMCYYRVEAKASGDPEPEIEFSSDDNVNNIGSGRVEVGVEVGDFMLLQGKGSSYRNSKTNSYME
jgi:hypothetical protein